MNYGLEHGATNAYIFESLIEIQNGFKEKSGQSVKQRILLKYPEGGMNEVLQALIS